MDYPHLNYEDCCWNVPGLIDAVTSNLPHDLHSILDKLSNAPESPGDVEGVDGECLDQILYTATGEDNETKQWRDWPTTPPQDNPGQFVSFINRVTDVIRRLTSDGPFESSETDLTFLDRGSLRDPAVASQDFPDFILGKRRTAKLEDLTWMSIHCVGVFGDSYAGYDVRNTTRRLAEYARRCFDGWARRFVLGIGIFHTKFSLFVFDRTGILSSQIFDVNEHPIEFLRAVVCLPFLDLTDTGRDITCNTSRDIIRGVPGEEYNIIFEGGRRYVILETMNNTIGRLVGKGTRCLKVKDDAGKIYLLKDCWPLRTQAAREIKMLDLIKDLKNVPKLISYGFLDIEDSSGCLIPDSTERMRIPIEKARLELDALEKKGRLRKRDGGWETWELKQYDPCFRDHLRCIMSPCGNFLEEFKSLPELVSALLDVLETIDELDKRGIVHGGISQANIILVPTEGSPYRTGYLIDFQTAIKRGSDYFTETNLISLMFVNTGRTENEGLCALGDAESLLYVLIFITIAYTGPNQMDKDFDIDESIFGATAMLPPDLFSSDASSYVLGKCEVMSYTDEFEAKVLQRMHPYFHPLRKCVSDLRELIYWVSLHEGLEDWKRMSPEENELEAKMTRQSLNKMKGILRATLFELEQTERIAKLPFALRPRPPKRPASEEESQSKICRRKR